MPGREEIKVCHLLLEWGCLCLVGLLKGPYAAVVPVILVLERSAAPCMTKLAPG